MSPPKSNRRKPNLVSLSTKYDINELQTVCTNDWVVHLIQSLLYRAHKRRVSSNNLNFGSIRLKLCYMYNVTGTHIFLAVNWRRLLSFAEYLICLTAVFAQKAISDQKEYNC